MKKIFAFLLTLIMMFSFIACSNGNSSSKSAMTKEEMISQATEMTDEMWKKAAENSAYAESLVDKTFSFIGIVSEIETDYVTMFVDNNFSSINGFLDLNVYLPSEQLLELEKGSKLSIVGNINEINNTEEIINGSKIDRAVLVMKQAYIVEDHFTFEGTLLGENDSYGGWNVRIGDDDIAYIVHFDDGVDTSSFKYGQDIKFLAKFSGAFYDATIVE